MRGRAEKKHEFLQGESQRSQLRMSEDESQEEEEELEEQIRRKVEKSEKDIILQKKMMQKLKVAEIPAMEFISADEVLKFNQIYSFIKVMGYGGFGIVVAAKELKTGMNLALKIVDKSDSNTAHHVRMLKHEAEILEELNHENIITIYNVTHYTNYIVMALKLTKENLMDYVTRMRKQGRPPSEEDCAKIMTGLFKGIAYLHDEKNIIHRDLKPGNALVGSYKDLTQTQIIDFGLAIHNKKENIVDYEHCGTLLYQPPEQAFNQFNYGKMADMWAAGIIMFEIIAGHHPFYKVGETRQQVTDKLSVIKEFHYPDHMSLQSRHLIERLCCRETAQRFSAAQALQHPWITRHLEEDLPLTIFERQQQEGQKFAIEEKFRKVQNSMYFLALIKHHVNQTKNLVNHKYKFRIRTEYSSKLSLAVTKKSSSQLLSNSPNDSRPFNRRMTVPQISVVQTPSLMKKEEQRKLKAEKGLTARSGSQSSEEECSDDKSQHLTLKSALKDQYFEDLSPDLKNFVRNAHIKMPRRGTQAFHIKKKTKSTSRHSKRSNASGQINQQLEVPSESPQKKAKRQNAPQLANSVSSQNSPNEIRIECHEHISDLQSSSDSLHKEGHGHTEKHQCSNGSSPFHNRRGSHLITSKHLVKRPSLPVATSDDNRLPDIGKKGSLQIKNSNKQGKDALTKIKIQKTQDMSRYDLFGNRDQRKTSKNTATLDIKSALNSSTTHQKKKTQYNLQSGYDSIKTPGNAQSPEAGARQSLVKMLNEAVKEEELKIKNMGKNIKKPKKTAIQKPQKNIGPYSQFESKTKEEPLKLSSMTNTSHELEFNHFTSGLTTPNSSRFKVAGQGKPKNYFTPSSHVQHGAK